MPIIGLDVWIHAYTLNENKLLYYNLLKNIEHDYTYCGLMNDTDTEKGGISLHGETYCIFCHDLMNRIT